MTLDKRNVKKIKVGECRLFRMLQRKLIQGIQFQVLLSKIPLKV